MNAMTRFFCCAVAVGGLLLSGCGAKFMPSFKPQVGDKRTIEQSDFLTLTMQVMGNPMPFNVSNSSRWTCEVTGVDEAGAVTLKVTAEQIQADFGADMMKNLPGGGADLSFLKKAQDALKGQSFTATVSPSGEILHMEGAESFAKAAMSKITLPPVSVPGMNPKEMIEQSFGESMLRGQLKAWMAPYQAIEVKAGSKWSKQGQDSINNFELAYAQTFTVTEIKDGVARLSFDLQYTSGGGEATMGPLHARLDPQGGATGTIEMEAETGWITALYAERKMTAGIALDGMPSGANLSMEVTGNSSLKTSPAN